jgi:SAM-dependent methyltransferase
VTAPSSHPAFAPEHFARVDETPDEMFYSMPRLVTHIDDAACAALSAYYRTILHDGMYILDLMSSCVSHLPEELKPGRTVGHGMNATELKANPQLDEHFVQNLNRNPALPIEDDIFDACLIAVSVQYLVKPLAVLEEIARVLKPGGIVAISFSNRMFPTKAVAIWRGAGDEGHSALVGDYLRRTGAFRNIESRDISPAPGRSDPLYIVAGIAG